MPTATMTPYGASAAGRPWAAQQLLLPREQTSSQTAQPWWCAVAALQGVVLASGLASAVLLT